MVNLKQYVKTESFNEHSFKGYVIANYKLLASLFGESNCFGSDEKITSLWLLQNVDTKETVSIYDYKSTNLYSSDLPSVKEFRELPSVQFHVGSQKTKTAKDFIDWLEAVTRLHYKGKGSIL